MNLEKIKNDPEFSPFRGLSTLILSIASREFTMQYKLKIFHGSVMFYRVLTELTILNELKELFIKHKNEWQKYHLR